MKSPLIHSFSQGYFVLTLRLRGREVSGGRVAKVGWGVAASDVISRALSSVWVDQSVFVKAHKKRGAH